MWLLVERKRHQTAYKGIGAKVGWCLQVDAFADEGRLTRERSDKLRSPQKDHRDTRRGQVEKHAVCRSGN